MEDYSAKLTAEPFLYNETKTIAKFLLDGEEEEKLRKRNIEEKEKRKKEKEQTCRSTAGAASGRKSGFRNEKQRGRKENTG